MSTDSLQHPATIATTAQEGVLSCEGMWTILGLAELNAEVKSLGKQLLDIIKVDASKIIQMDSAGALALSEIIKTIKAAGGSVTLDGLDTHYQKLLSLVDREVSQVALPALERIRRNFFYIFGRWAVTKYQQSSIFIGFVGEMIVSSVRMMFSPRRIKWGSIVASVDDTGYKAIPIVAFMAFLIGVVLAYQLGTELRVYGANIFVVDVTGIAILREFGPLITAVIIAGRTSTSFAALIGTMIVNEEVSALKTMGLSPFERLVLPRIFALIIVMPLLTIWADLFGVLGSMVMSKNMLGIGYISFLERFEYAVPLKHYILGLIKAPVFAMIISSVGCFEGFQVGNSAESVGKQTTKAAVLAIFLIIIADAAFSVIFSELGY